MGGLDVLRDEVARDLARLAYPSKPWLRPRRMDGMHVHDVVIVGGGQCGLAAAFGLMLEKVTNVVVLDGKEAGTEGPWLDYARMPALRTDKSLTGLDWNIPSLTAQAWFEARHGSARWARIDRVPREDWQSYLGWFASVTGLPVRNGVRVELIREHRDGVLAIDAQDAGTALTLLARKVVLATGMEGNGALRVPSSVEAMPRALWAHAAENVPFAALAGRSVCVLGSGASAFDNAAAALEAGAARVSVVARRTRLPTINPANWIQFSGFLAHYADMPVQRRHEFLSRLFEHRQPATQRQYDLCVAHPRFSLILGADTDALGESGGAVEVPGAGAFDFLVSATGFEVDLAKRPELRAFEGAIARWSDRYTPREGRDALAQFPFLGDGFEFTERVPGTAPALRNIHNFAFGAAASMGITGGSITGIKYGARRLVSAITRTLFLDDADIHYADLLGFAEDELLTGAAA